MATEPTVDSTPSALDVYLDAVERKDKSLINSDVVASLYGRFAFTYPSVPGGAPPTVTRVEDRLRRNLAVCPDPPDFTFVLAADALMKLPGYPLRELLVDVLGWDASPSVDRAEADPPAAYASLVVFDGSLAPKEAQVFPASVDGLLAMCRTSGDDGLGGVAARIEAHESALRALAGPDHFHTRIEMFSEYWEDWEKGWSYAWGGCSLTKEEIDSLQPLMTTAALNDIPVDRVTVVDIRKWIFDTLWGNRYYGFDGYTYSSSTGKRADPEYFVRNMAIEELKGRAITLPVR